MGVGGFLSVLAWLDSGFLITGLVAFVVLCLMYGVWMTRRMSRFWPSARQLNGQEREQVVRSARGGLRLDKPRLAPALIDYRNGLHQAADEARMFRWLVWFVLVVAVVMAVWDAAFGSWGNAVVSAIYLAMLLLEVFWWPRRQQRLLANADRAVEMAGERAE